MKMPTQRFETNISGNYLPNWDELYVVKEFIQNLVYAKTILGDEVSIEHDGEYAIIKNSPSGFDKGKLLIGESEQRGVTGSPGNFGEGFKLAVAVANRLGMDCEISTNGFDVQSSLEPSSLDQSVNALVFYISDTEKHEGTTFKIQCTKKVLDEAKSYFAVLNGLDAERTKRNEIMPDFKGIYANGVKITDTPAVFGYNFTDTELINRDRTTLNMAKLKEDTRILLMETEDEKVITEVLTKVVEDDSLLESQSGAVIASNSNLWRKVARKVFGDKVALATGTGSDTQARYKKFKILASVPKAWKYFFTNILDIRPTNELRATTLDTNVHRKASAEENKNLGWAKRLVKLYYADYGTVRVSEVVKDSFGNECLGLYDREKDTIWLCRTILSHKEELFKTLLHETIHRKTGASDNTEDFTRGWEDACWGILNRGR
jgi:hypothetical protein